MRAMQTYEVEVKALLGSAERADAVRAAMKKLDPSCTRIGTSKQRNHYFEPADGAQSQLLERLLSNAAPHLSKEAAEKLEEFAGKANEFSVRTRDKNGEVFLVVKASIADPATGLEAGTSENGIARMEFEEKVDITLDELDALVAASGFRYQAKWSREREEYSCSDIHVTLDRNAGYGWLAEFERVVSDESELADAQRSIRALMDELGVEELSQERLARMFDFYNAHWQEYYGTDKVFVVE
ncbi:hypothetical protein COU20_02920 [Candidatus Kaiserbacteria bacterium CG10_big_fil_rev_8_21_14_0_10_59_10]|uniref:CYTH domain-containing protein n=1 Tax=Candidatus Kaiserbacteria bacterium CG10_big_fil_rev_8_21_14_0_10_59_10 TaxID=1974612 RepID=A0A2H0U7G2_9BACT|nr:MAG: hypothetical protein COU20_02920 [Candidatus Kaiserbacteria bacterium CG10_big_fil_rev_8_21_14_0_10_59_10]